MNTNRRHIAAALAQLALFAALLASLAAPAAGAQAAPRERCFQETGFCASGAILDYWERNGGLAVFGYPIGDETIETVEGSWSGPTQWFERDRLEDHSNEGKGVLAGRLAAQILESQGRRWQTFPTISEGESPARCSYYPQTQHNMCAPFENYWAENGGLARFGYPITQPFEEQIEGRTYLVQYFERRRMEYHPEHAGTAYEVQLGLLGRDIYVQREATPEKMAQNALTTFMRSLSVGNYANAAAFYGGDYQQLMALNPDVAGAPQSGEAQAKLWRRACTVNGFVCLPVREVLSMSRDGATLYIFTVSLSAADGKPFRNAAGQTRFIFTVQQIGGQYAVIDMPPYQS